MNKFVTALAVLGLSTGMSTGALANDKSDTIQELLENGVIWSQVAGDMQQGSEGNESASIIKGEEYRFTDYNGFTHEIDLNEVDHDKVTMYSHKWAWENDTQDFIYFYLDEDPRAECFIQFHSGVETIDGAQNQYLRAVFTCLYRYVHTVSFQQDLYGGNYAPYLQTPQHMFDAALKLMEANMGSQSGDSDEPM